MFFDIEAGDFTQSADRSGKGTEAGALETLVDTRTARGGGEDHDVAQGWFGEFEFDGNTVTVVSDDQGLDRVGDILPAGRGISEQWEAEAGPGVVDPHEIGLPGEAVAFAQARPALGMPGLGHPSQALCFGQFVPDLGDGAEPGGGESLDGSAGFLGQGKLFFVGAIMVSAGYDFAALAALRAFGCLHRYLSSRLTGTVSRGFVTLAYAAGREGSTTRKPAC